MNLHFSDFITSVKLPKLKIKKKHFSLRRLRRGSYNIIQLSPKIIKKPQRFNDTHKVSISFRSPDKSKEKYKRQLPLNHWSQNIAQHICNDDNDEPNSQEMKINNVRINECMYPWSNRTSGPESVGVSLSLNANNGIKVEQQENMHDMNHHNAFTLVALNRPCGARRKVNFNQPKVDPLHTQHANTINLSNGLSYDGIDENFSNFSENLKEKQTNGMQCVKAVARHVNFQVDDPHLCISTRKTVNIVPQPALRMQHKPNRNDDNDEENFLSVCSRFASRKINGKPAFSFGTQRTTKDAARNGKTISTIHSVKDIVNDNPTVLPSNDGKHEFVVNASIDKSNVKIMDKRNDLDNKTNSFPVRFSADYSTTHRCCETLEDAIDTKHITSKPNTEDTNVFEYFDDSFNVLPNTTIEIGKEQRTEMSTIPFVLTTLHNNRKYIAKSLKESLSWQTDSKPITFEINSSSIESNKICEKSISISGYKSITQPNPLRSCVNGVSEIVSFNKNKLNKAPSCVDYNVAGVAFHDGPNAIIDDDNARNDCVLVLPSMHTNATTSIEIIANTVQNENGRFAASANWGNSNNLHVTTALNHRSIIHSDYDNYASSTLLNCAKVSNECDDNSSTTKNGK